MSSTGEKRAVPDEPPAIDLENTVRGGTRWVFIGQIASQLISFLVLAVLYRFVTPDQYGLLGMVVPLLLLAKIFASFGLNVATVQRRHLADGQLSSVFWISLLVSVVVALCMAAGGPILAWLYDTPSLSLLCAALAGTLVIAAVGAQHQALLERKLQMRRLAAARIAALLAGGSAAIALAVMGLGVWALVAQQYAELAVLALMVWSMEPWRPRPVGRGEPVGAMLRFGGYYSLSSLMFFVAQNADKILIALLLGSTHSGQAALGMYSQAFNLMMKPVFTVTTPITGIMLPALARVSHLRDDFTQFIGKFFRIVGIVSLPAGIGLTVVAQDAMRVLGGPAWEPAGRLLTLLAPAILAQGFVSIAGSVFAASGRAGRLFLGSLGFAVVLSVGCITGFWIGGQFEAPPAGPTLGVAGSFSLVTVVILFIPYMLYCFRTVGVSFAHVFRPLVKSALMALLMGIAVAALRWELVRSGVPELPRLIASVLFGALVYIGGAWSEIRWLVEQLRSQHEPCIAAPSARTGHPPRG